MTLPTLHAGQHEAYKLPGRFKAVRCGRRWGKTLLAAAVICDGAARGESWGLFSPDYKIMSETYREIAEILAPIIASSSKIEGVIRTITGGRVDFWTLNNPQAGRSRKYHGVMIDEAAFAGPDMGDIWSKAIKPALLDYQGVGWALSTPSGKSDENWFYNICTDPTQGFVEFHAPTATNPYLPQDELARLEHDNSVEVYRQEYLAEFVDWSGVAFFTAEMLLEDGQPIPMPTVCDAVFVTIDTAVKTGQENDCTAAVFWAYNRTAVPKTLHIIDWDILQIEGASLEHWLPSVFTRLEELSRICGARFGVAKAWIEDKSSGMILLQQARNNNWPTEPIDSKLTALGKSERAIAASPYVYRGGVKITREAFDKTTILKGKSANHLITQLTGFRIGLKDGAADDLLDAFCYGVCLALGSGSGDRRGV
jgi:hypothetical protein